MSNKITFTIGVIHPYKHKITADRPIEDAGLPETVYIPVKQHIAVSYTHLTLPTTLGV